MKLHFATIPIHSGAAAEVELNQFLSSHRLISVERQFVSDGPRSAWAICVTYDDASAGTANADASDKKGRVDYREVLNEADFRVFAGLRDLRKRLAERDRVPPYAVFTNEQLAEMVRRRVRSPAELTRIDGVGAARAEKYSSAFLEMLQTSLPINSAAEER